MDDVTDLQIYEIYQLILTCIKIKEMSIDLEFQVQTNDRKTNV